MVLGREGFYDAFRSLRGALFRDEQGIRCIDDDQIVDSHERDDFIARLR